MGRQIRQGVGSASRRFAGQRFETQQIAGRDLRSARLGAGGFLLARLRPLQGIHQQAHALASAARGDVERLGFIRLPEETVAGQEAAHPGVIAVQAGVLDDDGAQEDDQLGFLRKVVSAVD